MRRWSRIHAASTLLVDRSSSLNSGTRIRPLAQQIRGRSTASGIFSLPYCSLTWTWDYVLTFLFRPDNCDGTWEEFCAPDREYFNISAILSESAPCTLKYMQDYFKDYQGDDEDFWEHEFNKHGTCMSTLDPACYPDFEPGQEVTDYFKRTVKLFKQLPSYDWLAEAGIVPSFTTTYTAADIQAAIRAHHGYDVIINCRNGELDEMWYHFNVQGSIQSGNFIPVPPVGSPSNCPKTGIKYLPKYSTAPEPTFTTSTVSNPGPTGAPGALSGKGRFYVTTDASSSGGFLISAGTWYRGGGTPATYTATADADGSPTFTLKTSKGFCIVRADTSLFCDASVSAGSSFGYDGTYLTYGESNTFFAASLPAGTDQGLVYTSPNSISFQAEWRAV